jgi:hypothetical protein
MVAKNRVNNKNPFNAGLASTSPAHTIPSAESCSVNFVSQSCAKQHSTPLTRGLEGLNTMDTKHLLGCASANSYINVSRWQSAALLLQHWTQLRVLSLIHSLIVPSVESLYLAIWQIGTSWCHRIPKFLRLRLPTQSWGVSARTA